MFKRKIEMKVVKDTPKETHQIQLNPEQMYNYITNAAGGVAILIGSYKVLDTGCQIALHIAKTKIK